MHLVGDTYERIQPIIAAITQHKGRALLVGGAVRDMVMNLPIKDVDIEVYRLTEQELENILKAFGPVSLVGKAFGVLRIHGLDVDWSLPRADSPGRKPTVIIDVFESCLARGNGRGNVLEDPAAAQRWAWVRSFRRPIQPDRLTHQRPFVGLER